VGIDGSEVTAHRLAMNYERAVCELDRPSKRGLRGGERPVLALHLGVATENPALAIALRHVPPTVASSPFRNGVEHPADFRRFPAQVEPGMVEERLPRVLEPGNAVLLADVDRGEDQVQSARHRVLDVPGLRVLGASARGHEPRMGKCRNVVDLEVQVQRVRDTKRFREGELVAQEGADLRSFARRQQTLFARQRQRALRSPEVDRHRPPRRRVISLPATTLLQAKHFLTRRPGYCRRPCP
jgi:hypothetical protein